MRIRFEVKNFWRFVFLVLLLGSLMGLGCQTIKEVSKQASDNWKSAPKTVSGGGRSNIAGGDGNLIYIVNNLEARDPSWSELLDFLREDPTDKQVYVPDGYQSFVCADFAEMLHNNAEIAGWRAAYVVLDLEGEDHTLNAFQTTDRGLVFIDSTASLSASRPFSMDALARIKEGQMYKTESLFPQKGWSSFSSIDIVLSIDRIQW